MSVKLSQGQAIYQKTEVFDTVEIILGHIRYQDKILKYSLKHLVEVEVVKIHQEQLQMVEIQFGTLHLKHYLLMAEQVKYLVIILQDWPAKDYTTLLTQMP